jgi:hypothetical protein
VFDSLRVGILVDKLGILVLRQTSRSPNVQTMATSEAGTKHPRSPSLPGPPDSNKRGRFLVDLGDSYNETVWQAWQQLGGGEPVSCRDWAVLLQNCLESIRGNIEFPPFSELFSILENAPILHRLKEAYKTRSFDRFLESGMI